MSGRLIRNGVIYSVANALSAGVPFLLLPVLTRALSPADYGEVIGFFMLVSLSNALAGLSVHAAVSVKWFERASMDLPRFVGTALALATASTMLCGCTLLVASTFLRARLDLPPHDWFLAALQAGATVVIGMRTALWQSQGRALPAAALQVATAVLNMASSLAGVFLLDLGGEGRILGSVAASTMAAAGAVRLLFREGDAAATWSSADARALLRFGVPLVPHAMAGAIMVTADRFSIASVLGPKALGIYGTAAQLGMVLVVLGDAFVKTFSPWMYTQLASRTARGQLRIVATTYLLMPAWITLALLAWGVLELAGGLVVGTRYLAAVDLSVWFLLGGALSSIYLSIAGVFFFSGRTEWLSLATVATAAVATILAPTLARHFGLMGAAASFLMVQALSLALSWGLSLRVRPLPWLHPLLAWRVLRRPRRAAA